MNLPIRSRQLLQAASAAVFKTPQRAQQRSIFGWGQKKNDVYAPPPNTLLTEEFLKRKPKNERPLVKGDLSASSIFEDETIAGPKSTSKTGRKTKGLRNPRTMAAKLDPDPDSRKRWQRKMVIQEIHKRGRLTKTQALRRSERELTSKSHNIKTSVKKLGPLARQIAGKTVEEAIVQMRFSPKKAAKSVQEHLEHARNEAIVKMGMGLGPDGEPRKIVTSEGQRVTVRNSTTLYVSQAWVGKGDFGRTPDYRARGQTNIMQNPTTHIAVLLKEEATRIRQHDERVQKVARRKVWTQLPNRPINHQRQHYSW